MIVLSYVTAPVCIGLAPFYTTQTWNVILISSTVFQPPVHLTFLPFHEAYFYYLVFKITEMAFQNPSWITNLTEKTGRFIKQLKMLVSYFVTSIGPISSESMHNGYFMGRTLVNLQIYLCLLQGLFTILTGLQIQRYISCKFATNQYFDCVAGLWLYFDILTCLLVWKGWEQLI